MVDGLPDALAYRLGYLLKHAQQQLAQVAARATAPFGIDGRELATLAVLGADAPLSQQEAAEQLGIDRTTMVAHVDALEEKGARRAPPQPG
jgi:DNA-binding MarR family transcriptional regulator